MLKTLHKTRGCRRTNRFIRQFIRRLEPLCLKELLYRRLLVCSLARKYLLQKEGHYELYHFSLVVDKVPSHLCWGQNTLMGPNGIYKRLVSEYFAFFFMLEPFLRVVPN